MNQRVSTSGAPSSILVATDLSCRCDRALDRAVSTAREWKARLVVLTVIDPAVSAAARERYADVPSWWNAPNFQAITERRLRADVPTDVASTVRVVEGAVVDTVLQVAAEEGCGLIVTGVARDETFGRVVLGSTVDGLVRRSEVPLLVVRSRPRAPYHHVTVASDFSVASRLALQTVHKLFPEAALSVFHAFDAPYAGMAGVDRGAMIEAQRASAARECEAFLEASELPIDVRRRVRCVLEYGIPSRLLDEYVVTHGVDLVALGSHGRSALFDLFFGSVAKRILEEASTDVLVVREPRA